jgi:outer membrane protein OmpA-like peptidoglycan-associated protein
MRTIKFLAAIIFISVVFTSLTSCHTSKKVTNRRYMATLHRDLKKHIKDAQVSKRGDTVSVVYPEVAMFDFGSDQVKKDALTSIEKFSGILREYCLIGAIANGYTDNIGTPDANVGLSKRRAENVKTLLETDGVGNTRIVTHGMGEANPVMTNATPEGRQANRRVEFVLYENK